MNSNNTMFQSQNVRSNQNGTNNNFNLQDSNSNISLAQSQSIPINRNSKKLYVQLTQEEQMFYSKLYTLIPSNLNFQTSKFYQKNYH